MKDINDHINSVIAKGELDVAELAVLRLLLGRASNGDSFPISQRQIATTTAWLGCHPEHEKNIVANEFETTTRKVRQVITGGRSG